MVSLHASYDEARAFYKRRGDKKNYIKQTILRYLTEVFVIKNATAIYCVYPNIFPYLNRNKRKDYSLIYNRVYAQDFPRKANHASNKLKILTVGRLNEHKNIDVIIKSIQNTNYNLTVIGKGEEEQKLKTMVKDLNLEQQVTFISSIKNKDIANYYHTHDIFAMAMEAEGVSIPVIEAMACGMPIIVPEHIQDEIDAPLVYVKINPNDFHRVYKKFEDIKKRIKHGDANHKAFLKIEGNKMEEKEAELYVKIISKKIKK
jgi:glycosyltransferase involved in cell wall biosynthesis